MIQVRLIDDNGLFIEDAFVDEIPLLTEEIQTESNISVINETGEETFESVIDVEYINVLDEFGNVQYDPHYVETVCPSGFILPKWDGVEWVEGGVKPELTVEQKEVAYHERVVELIRERYSANDEIAIIRKKLAGLDEVEFDGFNLFVEECKDLARLEII